MDNNQNFNEQFGAQSDKTSNMSILKLLSLIFSGVGLLMVFLGTIFTCTCSAKKTFDTDSDGTHTMSLVWILTIIGVLVAIAGLVLGLIEMKKASDKLVLASVVVAIFSVILGLLPLFTICGYNCSLNSASEKMAEKSMEDVDLDDLSDLFD